jgi:putative transposase
MKIYRAYKTELDPNNKQRTALSNHAGAARFAYNWGLEQKIKSYREKGTRPTFIDLNKCLNILKRKTKEEGGFPWLYGVSKCAPQYALQNVDRAFDGFFRRCKEGKRKPGFPKFKSKKKGEGSFKVMGRPLRVEKGRIHLPRLGAVRLKEKDYLPDKNREDVKVLFAVISEKAGRWYVSLQVEQEIPDPLPIKDEDPHVVGVDVGLKEFAVTSDGEVFENPKAYAKAQKRLRFLQKEVDRKQKGSKNQKKARVKVAKQHIKIANIRRDNQHKASTAIAKSADVIVIENLNVEGMKQNRCLSKAVSDAGMSTFLRQIEYKAEWAGKQVIEASRWYPSSKTCSSPGCGFINKDLTLKDRSWVCPDCGAKHDRNFNASVNLKNLAGSSPVSACCPGASTSDRIVPGQALVGQEPNTSLGG